MSMFLLRRSGLLKCRRQRSPETPLGALPLDPASKKPIPESPHPTPEGEKELGDTPNPGRRASYLLHLSPGGLHISFFLSYVLNLSMSMRSMSMENKTEWGR